MTAAFAAAGDVDIVVINPAEIFYAAVEAIPLDKLQGLFNLNTVGALRVAQAALPGMRARGDGKLLFMSSVVGRITLPTGAAYAATKWALEALVEALAIEVALVRRSGHAARARCREFRRARRRDDLHAARRSRTLGSPAMTICARR